MMPLAQKRVITRHAIFEGKIRDGQDRAFRQAILNTVVPRWRQLPGAIALRVTFADERDAGAPDYPAIIAIDYPDATTLARALISRERDACREALEGQVLPLYFTGRLHHHVTTTYALAACADSSAGERSGAPLPAPGSRMRKG